LNKLKKKLWVTFLPHPVYACAYAYACIYSVVCRSYYIHLAECVYAETKQHCSLAAASHLVTYFLDGWRPYLSYNYDCEIGKAVEIIYYAVDATENGRPEIFRHELSNISIFASGRWRKVASLFYSACSCLALIFPSLTSRI